MNQITSLTLMLVTLSAVTLSAIAAPIVKSETDYYLISGDTESEIRKSIDRRSPVHEDGTTYDAHTDWVVEWEFWWEQSNGQCTITKVETRVDIKFILPELKNSKTLPKALREKWDNYMKALVRHEKEHGNIGVQSADEIEGKILNITSRRTCKQLEVDANDIGSDTIEKFHIINKEYDRKTKHGANEGAIFP